MSPLNKFIVSRHRPYFYVIILIAAVTFTFLIQRYVHLYTTKIQQQKVAEFHQLDDLYQHLLKKSKEMEQYIALSNSHLEKNKHELHLQKETIQQLEKQLNSQQEQFASLNKDLLFYQAITQGDRPKKLQIRELVLRTDPDNSDIVHYQLVVTQGEKVNQALTGTIEIVGDMAQDEPVIIAEHSLNLRHVQLIKGQIQLLDTQVPESISVIIKQKNKTLLSQSFNWQLSPAFE